jgi:hypothetical protein
MMASADSNWHGGDAIQGDLDAVMFNPIASFILIIEGQMC